MFADDFVVREKYVKQHVERWKFAVERRGMTVTRSKKESVCENERNSSRMLRLQGGKDEEGGYSPTPIIFFCIFKAFHMVLVMIMPLSRT